MITVDKLQNEMLDVLTGADKLLALMMKQWNKKDMSDEVAEELGKLMNFHFTESEAKGLLMLMDNVCHSIGMFKQYYRNSYRENSKLVKGTNTVN